jgi:D-alanyl-D-alanine carboxypeptidase/D-alanyl-D-alanine-endopeptidase (penicillin-binding protein 4)
VTRAVAVVNPTVFFAQAFREALLAQGFSVTGEAADLDDVSAEPDVQGERRTIASTVSPPLRTMAIVLMKVSQNLYAETFLKAVGRARGGLGTVAAGRDAVRATLTSWGIPDTAYIMADGSGLSRYNYVSVATITSILERMYKDPRHRDALITALPIAGKDGTVTTRMRRTRAEGNAVAKTGSIANVRSLSGFVRTRDGEMVVFSILANHFVIPAATVNWIADLGVEVLANFTRRH